MNSLCTGECLLQLVVNLSVSKVFHTDLPVEVEVLSVADEQENKTYHH